MPALAPAPAPGTGVTPAAAPATDAVAFVGRSLAEYAQFFALDPVALRGRDVLDVGAGPSSFTAEACARKIHAVAVDPRYGRDVAPLGIQVQLDHAVMSAQLRTKRRLAGRRRSGFSPTTKPTRSMAAMSAARSRGCRFSTARSTLCCALTCSFCTRSGSTTTGTSRLAASWYG